MDDWQAYKSFFIEGDLIIPIADFIDDFSDFLAALKTHLSSEFTAPQQGYNPPTNPLFDNTVINWHIHYLDERALVAGEF